LVVTPELKKRLCPICNSEMIKVRYLGQDIFHRFDCFGDSDIMADYCECGANGFHGVAWEKVTKDDNLG
jgi:hypothetical protein